MPTEAVRDLPADVTALPIAGLWDIRSRLEKLVAEFDRISRLPEAFALDTVAETTKVFDTAAQRLRQVID
jgi:hypothetical protein